MVWTRELESLTVEEDCHIDFSTNAARLHGKKYPLFQNFSPVENVNLKKIQSKETSEVKNDSDLNKPIVSETEKGLKGETVSRIDYDVLKGYFGTDEYDLVIFYLLVESYYNQGQIYKTPIICCLKSPDGCEFKLLEVVVKNE